MCMSRERINKGGKGTIEIKAICIHTHIHIYLLLVRKTFKAFI